MKAISFLKGIFISPLFLTISLAAQQKISFDIGAIRQKNHHNGGINASGFYHFNEHFLGGLEVNRFFPVHRITGDEEELLSGWDFEMNIHYLLSVRKGWKCYPITGISHTSEKDFNESTHQSQYERFWSVNTGAGLLLEAGKWLPFVEYNFSWGHLNQQFLLFGIGYEIEWKRHKQEQSNRPKKD